MEGRRGGERGGSERERVGERTSVSIIYITPITTVDSITTFRNMGRDS